MAEIIRELQEERASVIKRCNEINDKANAEKRDLNAEERTNYDAAWAKQGELKDRIERAKALREEERALATADPARDENRDRKPAKIEQTEIAEYRDLWVRDRGHVVRNGKMLENDRLNSTERTRLTELESKLRSDRGYRAWLKALGVGSRDMTREERDLMMGSDPAGGFTVPPEQFQATLLRKVDDYTFVRQRATKVTVVKAQDLGVPTLEDNPADSDWTSELATGTADSTMDFGKRAFSPHPLAKQMKVSKKLLRASVIDIDSLITDRLGYKTGITQEKAFLTGNGAQQPLGLFTASNNGISTGRDVSTGNSTTAIGADNLRYIKYSLKAPYRRNAAWLFHRDGIKQISLLKDGDGQYLWKASITEGDPDMLLGMPVMESEYVPNTFTTGLYVGMLGDYSYFWIADALDMTIQALFELYAATNQNGYILRLETDGMPVFEEAFARVKLA